MNTVAVDELAYWITQREKIRKLKEAGAEKPWSKDPVFQSVYFCNVHREDDKVTEYIRGAYSPFAEHEMFIPNIMLTRLVNRIESLTRLGYFFEWYPEHFEYIAATLKPFWGSAYVVTTHGRRMSKVQYACEVLQAAFEKPPVLGSPPTLATAHRRLMQYEGFGSFMAAQVVADLKNTRGHPLSHAEDWYNWSAPGPGSMRGLKWIYGPNATQGNYELLMKQLHATIHEKVAPIQMCEQDLQNCLCEFDKYMRVKTGAGRSKRKYDGG